MMADAGLWDSNKINDRKEEEIFIGIKTIYWKEHENQRIDCGFHDCTRRLPHF